MTEQELTDSDWTTRSLQKSIEIIESARTVSKYDLMDEAAQEGVKRLKEDSDKALGQLYHLKPEVYVDPDDNHDLAGLDKPESESLDAD